MTRYVVPLSACEPGIADRVGGKALGLGSLIREGLPVPSGFAVTTDAYRESLTATGLQERIAELLESADSAELQTASAELRGLFAHVPPADAVVHEIVAAYRDLGENIPVAVRSSATAEDTAEASFAGQQDTYLWIQGADAMVDHIVRCWASLFTPQAIAYRKRFRVPLDGLAMGVVVQRMVPADVAGVMMTIDPVTGDRSTIYLAAAYGLGEGVVKGDVGSDGYKVDKESLEVASREISSKSQAHRFDPGVGEVRLIDVPEADENQPALTDDEIAAIARVGRRIEEALAQDVEWALVRGDRGSEIFLLQSRPETVWSQRSGSEDRLHNAPDLLHHPTPAAATWSTTNLAESIPGVPTPLGWSIWYRAGELAVRRTFHSIGALSRREAEIPARVEDSVIGIFYGHTAIRVDLLCEWVERIPGVDGAAMAEQTFSAVPQGYVSRPQPRYYPRVLAHSLMPWLLGPRLIREDYRRVERRYSEAMAALPSASLEDARSWLDEGAAIWTESLYRQALVTLGTVQPTVDRLLRLADLGGVSGQELMAGYGGHEENRAIVDAWECSRGRLDLETFVARHGYHGWRSGEISSAVWREDPALAQALIERYRAKREEASPEIAARERVAKRAALEAQLLAALPPHRRLQARVVLKLAARYVPLRGVGKVSFLRGVDIARAAARRIGEQLAAAGILDEPDDAFYLTLDEHRAGPGPDAKDLVRERRGLRGRYEPLDIPQSFRGIPPVVEPEVDPNAEIIEGTAASPGRVEGTARVITNPEDADVREGDILVAHDTDPSWASLMFLSAGLVADIGGIMSHTAVVARELGMPCVVNTKHATRVLRTGDRIRVDGTGGRIEILSRT